MIKRIQISFFLIGLNLVAIGQQGLNVRNNLGASNAILGSVIATDSCYYSIGFGVNPSNGSGDPKFVKFNFDGSVAFQSQIEFDTLNVNTWQKNTLITTNDGNFATLGRAAGPNSIAGLLFLKFSPNGDTIVSNYIDSFALEGIELMEGSLLIEDENGGFYGTSVVSRLSDVMGGTVFFRLNEFGELIRYKYFWGTSAFYYRAYIGQSLIRTESNVFYMGGSLIRTGGIGYSDYKSHSKLYEIDSMGNILNTYLYDDDRIFHWMNGLTRSSDGGFIYCGQDGTYDPESLGIDFKRSIIKIGADKEEEWRIVLGPVMGSFGTDYREIIELSGDNFVAVGYGADTINTRGALTKFNLNGEVLWDRLYSFVLPPIPPNQDYPDHKLNDVSITTDSGFVMVGQAFNYESPESAIGQHAWLVKVDKHGCLVPDCHLYDNIDITDTTIVVEPPIEPEPIPDLLYPNPANEQIYYYHHQDDFTGNVEGFVFNSDGKRIYYWSIDQNDITYIIPTGILEGGVYVLQIKENNQVLRSEKFVVSH